MTDDVSERYRIAVLLPCYNEAATIGAVVRGFRAALPAARIYVYDNNSTDGTALAALLAGAELRQERRQGKGHVVARMLADIEADLYVMADGDLTYDPAEAPNLIATLLAERADMVTGCRKKLSETAGRPLHAAGNRLLSALFRRLFAAPTTDLLSGYRVLTHRFAKTFPVEAAGFAVETEMAMHALRLKAPVAEVAVSYALRPAGSASKLATLPDGWRILRRIAGLAVEMRPRLVCALAAVPTAGLCAWLADGRTAALGTTLMFLTGWVLDAIARARNERLRLAYLVLPPPARLRETTPVGLLQRADAA